MTDFLPKGVGEVHDAKMLHGVPVAEPFHLTPEFYEGTHVYKIFLS